MKLYEPFTKGFFTDLFEVWKDIKGYEGHYQVSNHGTVKSMPRMRKTKGDSFAPLYGRILKQKTSKSGYKVLHLHANEDECHPSVHRLVALAFIDNPENKPTVNHIDGNKTNNKMSNLEWATSSEQMTHALKLDLIELRGAPKFSKHLKQEIHEYYKNNKISLLELAKMFNMSERTAGRIAKSVIPRTTTRVLKNKETVIENILTKDEVDEIKLLRLQGWTFAKLAAKFNRGLSQMHRVVNNKSRATTIE